MVARFNLSFPSLLIFGTSATKIGIENLWGFPLESLSEKEKFLIKSTGVLPFPNPVKGVSLSKLPKGIFNLIASPAERIVLGAPVSITASRRPKDLGYVGNQR